MATTRQLITEFDRVTYAGTIKLFHSLIVLAKSNSRILHVVTVKRDSQFIKVLKDYGTFKKYLDNRAASSSSLIRWDTITTLRSIEVNSLILCPFLDSSQLFSVEEHLSENNMLIVLELVSGYCEEWKKKYNIQK